MSGNFPSGIHSAKVGTERWFAGSADAHHFGRQRSKYVGMLRHKGAPRWNCPHTHDSTQDARDCAAKELARRST